MVVFVRNTVCRLSPAKFGATTATLIDKLLAAGARIGVSPPKVDPLGDYTLRLFRLMDRTRPGSAAALRACRRRRYTARCAAPQSRETQTWMRLWLGAWTPVSFIALAATGTPGCS